MMKKVLYLLFLLVFAACSDDDKLENGQAMSDFEKPFTKVPTTELKEILDDSFNRAWQEYPAAIDYIEEVIMPLDDALEHYGFYMPQSLRSRSEETEKSFVGLKLTWNKATQTLDKTLGTEGFMEVLIPSSLTDDSKNDLRVLIDVTDKGNRIKVNYYQNGKQVAERIMNRETSAYEMSLSAAPYTVSLKRTTNEWDAARRIAMITQMEVTVANEGQYTYHCNMNVDDDMTFVAECGNLRASIVVSGYQNMELLFEFLNNGEGEDFAELWEELLRANMKGVIVFADRNEKLCDLEMKAADNGQGICLFQDGTEYVIGVYILPFIM